MSQDLHREIVFLKSTLKIYIYIYTEPYFLKEVKTSDIKKIIFGVLFDTP